MDRVLTGKIKPGKVFDLELPLAEVAEAIARWTNDPTWRSARGLRSFRSRRNRTASVSATQQ
jgi:hypothetical protein